MDSKKKLTAFVSTDEELSLGNELKAEAAPQASTSNYDNHSGGIVATLEDMKDKAESQLANLRREETQQRHAYELIKQSLNDSIAQLQKEIEGMNAQKAAATEKLAQCTADKASTEAAKAADVQFKATLDQSCAQKADEWAARQKQAADEMGALNKGE